MQSHTLGFITNLILVDMSISDQSNLASSSPINWTSSSPINWTSCSPINWTSRESSEVKLNHFCQSPLFDMIVSHNPVKTEDQLLNWQLLKLLVEGHYVQRYYSDGHHSTVHMSLVSTTEGNFIEVYNLKHSQLELRMNLKHITDVFPGRKGFDKWDPTLPNSECLSMICGQLTDPVDSRTLNIQADPAEIRHHWEMGLIIIYQHLKTKVTTQFGNDAKLHSPDLKKDEVNVASLLKQINSQLFNSKKNEF